MQVAYCFLQNYELRSVIGRMGNARIKIRSTIFSDRCMLPLSMPVSNSATAFPSISRAGSAKFDLGAEHTSKHITIYGVQCYKH